MGKKATALDRRQRRKQQRHRFRTYARSLSALSDSDFARQTSNDLQVACMRSSILEAVMIARTIQKHAKAQQQKEWVEQPQSPRSSESLTEGQIFCQIFCTNTNLEEASTLQAPLSSCTMNMYESPLHAAISAGGTSMIHFILSCYVIFHLTEAHLAQPQTMMSWLEHVRAHKDKGSINIGVNWIENLAASSMRYLDGHTFNLPTLVDYVLPYLSPHTKLENACKRVAQNFVESREQNGEANETSDLSSIPCAEMDVASDDCRAKRAYERERCVNTESLQARPYSGLSLPLVPDADRSDSHEALRWDNDCVHVDEEDYSSDTNDNSSFVEGRTTYRNSFECIEDSEWEVVSNVSSILSF